MKRNVGGIDRILRIVGGLVLAVMRMSDSRVIAGVAGGYIWFFRGTPLLVQLLFWGFAAAIFPEVGIGLLGVSLAFGLTVVTMAFALGHISGCHLNPAVTLGLAAGGRFPASEVVQYIVAQVLGAIFAGFAPATDPRLVVVVMIDEPQGDAYHGGDIAAPVFANIVSGALRVLAVPPDALPAPAMTVVAQAQVGP